MKDLNGYILGLKLKRYDIATDSPKDDSYFEIGGSSISDKDYWLKGYIPLAIGIVILIIILATLMDANRLLRRVAFFVPVIVGGFGVSNLIHFSRKNASNQRLVVFEKGQIRIYHKSDDREFTYSASQIKDFSYTVELDKKDDLQHIGKFFFTDDNNKEHLILEVYEDENKKYLEDDMEYARSYLEQLVMGSSVETVDQKSDSLKS
jgi:hypothetical protein